MLNLILNQKYIHLYTLHMSQRVSRTANLHHIETFLSLELFSFVMMIKADPAPYSIHCTTHMEHVGVLGHITFSWVMNILTISEICCFGVQDYCVWLLWSMNNMCLRLFHIEKRMFYTYLYFSFCFASYQIYILPLYTIPVKSFGSFFNILKCLLFLWWQR